MEYYVTNQQLRYEHRTANMRHDPNCEMRLIKIYEDIRCQEIIGFGGALTESSGYVFSQLNAQNQETVLNMYFSEDGNRYNLGRLPIQSCDFSLGNRAYVDEGDTSLKTFSIVDDAKYQIPLIKSAQTRNPDIQFLASPWSPPAFMKTSSQMNRGGQLMK